jgi:hypothetical protein
MKTTSFEISKKLAEIGFNAESNYIITENGQIIITKDKLKNSSNVNGNGRLSFDLETILQALPKSIKYRGDTYYFLMTYSGSSDCYIIGYVCGQVRRTELEKYSEENESLADTAARLWLNLKKKGLV